MQDEAKTKEQLIDELIGLRQRIAGLEASEIERKQAEKTLRESEETAWALLNAPTDSAVLIDPAGIILAANKMAAQRLGKRVEELVGVCIFSLFPPDLAKSRRAQAAEVVRSEEPVRFEDEREERILDTTIYPVFDAQGKVGRMAIFVRDITERKRAEEELKQSFEKLQRTFQATVSALASSVEIRDPYMAGHQQRVAQLACAIAEEMGFPNEQIEGLRLAGLIHDIGKINVPAEILTKPGRLTETEFNMIKTHPQVGYELLKTIEFPWPIAQIVLQHHERMDGSGYPQGLAGKDILLMARILAVADVVQSMVSHRPYREALGMDKALEELSQNGDVLYDSQVVDACLELFSKKGFEFV